MSIEINTENAPFQGVDLASLEQALSRHLPSQYASFLRRVNVCRPRANIVEFGSMNCSVSIFLGKGTPAVDLVAQNKIYEGRIPNGFLVVALAAGGNLILLDCGGGGVFFWDHEEEGVEGAGSGVVKIASSFEEFLMEIKNFDESAINGNGKVISVQVAPDFKSKFGKYM